MKNISRFPCLLFAFAAITTDARARKILFPAKRINFNFDVMKHTSVGQLLLVGVQGFELGADEAKLLRRVQPGGCSRITSMSTSLSACGVP